jgi:pimeloyl-ACP methyl ester carboxylesterase
VKDKTFNVLSTDDHLGLDVGLLMLRKFQNARMRIFSNWGHQAHLEHADEFNPSVLDLSAE